MDITQIKFCMDVKITDELGVFTPEVPEKFLQRRLAGVWGVVLGVNDKITPGIVYVKHLSDQQVAAYLPEEIEKATMPDNLC